MCVVLRKPTTWVKINFFAITRWFYSSAFSEQFALYFKILAILVPEIKTILSCEVRKP